MGIVTGILWLGRECRHWQLTPVSGVVAAPQLRSEMAEIQCGIHTPVSNSQHGRNGIAEKLYVGNIPDAVMAREFEQTLTGSDMEPLRQRPRRSRANLRPRSRSASVIDRLLKNQDPLENRNNLRSSSPHPGPGQTSGQPRCNFAVRNSSTRELRLFRSPAGTLSLTRRGE